MRAVLLMLVLLAAMPWALPAEPRRTRRRAGHEPPASVDPAVLCDLVDAALAGGAAVPRVLTALGRANGGPVGEALRISGTSLLLGATWGEAWSKAPAELAELVHSLEPAWTDGTDPGPAVRRAAGAIRMRRQREARETAAALGVRLVLPLGLCALPAFVLLGVVPALLSAGTGLFSG